MNTNQERLPRHLVAILYADVVGFSRMTEQDEESTYRNLRKCLDYFTATIEQHGGQVMNYAGDAILAMFHSAEAALVCAAYVQNELEECNKSLPDENRIHFRIGLNLGDIIEDRGDIFGDGVNIAARLEGLGRPSGICISGSFYDSVVMKLPFDFEYMGEQHVKNITKPIRAYHSSLKPGESMPVMHKSDMHKKKEVNSPVKKRSSLLFPALGVSAVVALVVLLVLLWPSHDKAVPLASSPPDSSGLPSIIVLPFIDMSDDPDQAYFADGITEDVITDLSRLSGIQVLSRNTSFKYKGKTVTPKELGNELGVNYMLEGSIRKSRDKLRITAQLIEINNGYHVWAERYDRKLDEVFAVQDDVTRNIVNALAVQITKREEKALAHKATHNFAAYDLFLQGQKQHNERSKEANSLAQDTYRKVIKLDPTYARSYGALAVSIVVAVRRGWSDTPSESMNKALELARTATQMDKSSPQVFWSLGYVYLQIHEYDLAARAAKNSIAVSPNYSDAYALLALIYNHLGKAEEALELIKKAMLLNPYYTWEFLYIIGRAHYTLGNYELAVDKLNQALSRNGNAINPRIFLAASYSGLDMLEDAEWEIEQVYMQYPELSLSYVINNAPIQKSEKMKLYLEHLRKAGLSD